MPEARGCIRAREDPVRAWVAAWAGGAVLGVANGALREGTYGRRLPEPAANALSAATAIGLFATCFSFLQRRWPLRSRPQALAVGATWLGLTVCFEFGLGRALDRSWEELGAEYDLRRGRLWPLVLASLAIGPELARRGSCR
ncbi:MAG: hypothetical protein AB7V58_10530 [Solirubrobacterales bacterium]